MKNSPISYTVLSILELILIFLLDQLGSTIKCLKSQLQTIALSGRLNHFQPSTSINFDPILAILDLLAVLPPSWMPSLLTLEGKEGSSRKSGSEIQQLILVLPMSTEKARGEV